MACGMAIPASGGVLGRRAARSHAVPLCMAGMQRPLPACGAGLRRHPLGGRVQQQRQRPRPPCPGRRAPLAPAAAAAHFGGDGGLPLPQQQQQQQEEEAGAGGAPAALAGVPLLGPVVGLLAAYVSRVGGMWRRFLPMLSLFFCLSFTNTLLDSLKDTLVITAPGGGASVIPFLTVYAVLPCSVAFLLLYSWASARMSRAALFEATVLGFCAFFAAFALIIMPNADGLHAHALADALQAVLPVGLGGAVGMLRNWSFTAFFAASELWGDVCMGLLFWGLANDTTSLADAPTLYPLFGLGANLAQALAGVVLKVTTAARAGGPAGFCSEVQATMAVVLAGAGDAGGASGEARKVSLRESFAILAGSLEIRCLAVMSLAQGLCTSLMEFVWKSHMRLLYPCPSDFTAFLGDVAMWTGAVTAGLMLLSPVLFDRLGWRGVAGATPRILLVGGTAFFAAAAGYQYHHGAAAAAAAAAGGAPPAGALLSGLVLTGALLYVFSKAAKFSLFKPAEEMVYITLDEDGRTRGKAAIDVVGAQAGKSGGSVLQQAMLLLSAGALTGPILPVLFACFFLMARGWTGAVAELSSRRRYTLNSPIHTVDLDDDSGGGGGGGGAEPWPQPSAGSVAVVAAPPRPLGMGGAAPGGGVAAADAAAALDAAALAARLKELAERRRGAGAGAGAE
ncbi:MAG: TLC ATP/ADP transporter-domain-containing protein [Monoraphidium minutum]|nr:MAG: TLC ATP/ADP transporter-domain-containing protein [Monoraphidium minutum]